MDGSAADWLNPNAFTIGPLPIRWYSLAYLAGFVLGWRYAIRLARTGLPRPTAEEMDDFLTWAVLGTILGGRLGYVIFYQPASFASQPLEILKIWQGGMSFHGGLLGVAAAMVLFARRRDMALLALTDIVAAAAPIGLFFGRIANFVNQELYGRTTEMRWGVVFPIAGDEPRHPSQLYESALEGAVLFAILAILARRSAIRRRPGTLTGCFLIGYGVARFAVEYVRQPDPQFVNGTVILGATMGQLLSLPMIALGIGLIVHARRSRPEPRLA